MKKKNKYGAKITTGIDGRKYASKLEATRAAQLQDMERKGEIQELKYQQKFPIQLNDCHICSYIADFTYNKKIGNNMVFIVEDAKGVKTASFSLKAKMFKAYYGFGITLYPQRKRKL